MNNFIEARWNELVGPKDEVYHLGDFAFWRGREEGVRFIFHHLNGRKHLIKGDHDKQFIMDLGWETVKTGPFTLDGVLLLHDPFPKVPPSQKVFCGHVHDVWKMRRNVLNVGVDVWHFRPVPWETAIEYWQSRFDYYTRTGSDA